jgi:hypothetical protein
LGLSSGSPKIGTLVIPKLWMLISFSNKIIFESSRTIFYSLCFHFDSRPFFIS